MSSAVKAGAAFVELGMQTAGFDQNIAAAQSKLSGFASMVSAVGGMAGANITGLATSVSSVMGRLGGMIQNAISMPLQVVLSEFATTGDAIQKMSLRTGFSAESLSALGYAAEQSGTNLEEMELSIKALQRKIGEAVKGGASARKEFQQLGVSWKDLANLSPEKQFLLIANQVSKVEDETMRAEAAMKMLGKSGTRLLPLLEGGLGGIVALMQEAADQGVIISSEDADNAAKFGDAIDRVRKIYLGMKIKIASTLAEPLTKVLETVKPYLVAVSSAINKNKQLVFMFVAVATAVSIAAMAFMTFGHVCFAFMGITNLFSMILGTVTTALGGVAQVIFFTVQAFFSLYSALVLLIAGFLQIGTFIAFRAVLFSLQITSYALSAAIYILNASFVANKTVATIVRGVWYGLTIAASVLSSAIYALGIALIFVKTAFVLLDAAMAVFTIALSYLSGLVNLTQARFLLYRIVASVVIAAMHVQYAVTVILTGAFNLLKGAVTLLSGSYKLLIAALSLCKIGITGLAVAVAFCKGVITALNLELIIAHGLAFLIVGGFIAASASLLYFSGVGGKVFAFIKEQLLSFWQSFAGTFGAIKTALTNGDISGAAQVLWADLLYRFTLGKKALFIVFDEIREYSSSIWRSIQIYLADSFGITWDSIAEGWSLFCEGFLGVFQSACRGIASAWNTSGRFIAQNIGWIMAKVYGLDPEQMAKMIDEDYDQKMGMVTEGIDRAKADFLGMAGSIRDRIGELENDSEVQQRKSELDALIKEMNTKSKLEAPENDLTEKLNNLMNLKTPPILGVSGIGTSSSPSGTFSAFEALSGMQTTSIDKDMLEELKFQNEQSRLMMAIAKSIQEEAEEIKRNTKISDEPQVNNTGILLA